MEIWKVIVLAIWIVWTISFFFRSHYSVSDMEAIVYVAFLVWAVAIIAPMINWSWLNHKI